MLLILYWKKKLIDETLGRIEMKEVQITVFQCDHCAFQNKFKYTVEDHEKTCLEEQAWDEYYQRERETKMKQIEEDCVKWAREDKLLNLMVENDIDEETVRDRIREVYLDNVWDDVGWSGWRDEVYSKMYTAVKGE